MHVHQHRASENLKPEGVFEKLDRSGMKSLKAVNM